MNLILVLFSTFALAVYSYKLKLSSFKCDNEFESLSLSNEKDGKMQTTQASCYGMHRCDVHDDMAYWKKTKFNSEYEVAHLATYKFHDYELEYKSTSSGSCNSGGLYLLVGSHTFPIGEDAKGTFEHVSSMGNNRIQVIVVNENKCKITLQLVATHHNPGCVGNDDNGDDDNDDILGGYSVDDIIPGSYNTDDIVPNTDDIIPGSYNTDDLIPDIGSYNTDDLIPGSYNTDDIIGGIFRSEEGKGNLRRHGKDKTRSKASNHHRRRAHHDAKAGAPADVPAI